jgi:DNA replication protein DnaC
MFLANKSFESALHFFELKDYVFPDESQTLMMADTKTALDLAAEICKDIEGNLIDPGGFLVIIGEGNSGKSIVSHIIARESYLQGFTCQMISILDLSVAMSHRIDGNKAKANNGEILFDLEDYLDCDVVVVDDFEMVNHYFEQPNVRRALVLKLFRDRLKGGKPTIVLTDQVLKQQFTNFEIQDFPSVLGKNYRVMKLHGRFKKKLKEKVAGEPG